jgi:sugar phosphate isomerase/epimerase
MQVRLSAFADEISPDLDVQISTLGRLGVAGLDLSSVGGTNVLQLSDDQIVRVRRRCEERGLHVQAIGSPVNKVELTASNQASELAKLERAIQCAKLAGTAIIRIFSPQVPEPDYQNAWAAVDAWIAEQIFLAEQAGVVLIHENDARFYGAFPEGAQRLFETHGGPHFKAAFDFANTVLIGFRPFPDWFPWLLPHLHTLHIKDAIESQGQVVPAGEGQGQIAQTLSWLREQGWTGPMTLEPHLASAGKFGGFSGEQLFEEAVKAFRSTLSQALADSSSASR